MTEPSIAAAAALTSAAVTGSVLDAAPLAMSDIFDHPPLYNRDLDARHNVHSVEKRDGV